MYLYLLLLLLLFFSASELCKICIAFSAWTYVQKVNVYIKHGNLKGESAVVVILSSRMEASYCTSGFFRSPSNFVKHELPLPHGLTCKSCTHTHYRTVNHAVTIMCIDRAEIRGTITHLHMWLSIWPSPHCANTVVKKRPNSPFKFPW